MKGVYIDMRKELIIFLIESKNMDEYDLSEAVDDIVDMTESGDITVCEATSVLDNLINDLDTKKTEPKKKTTLKAKFINAKEKIKKNKKKIILGGLGAGVAIGGAVGLNKLGKSNKELRSKIGDLNEELRKNDTKINELKDQISKDEENKKKVANYANDMRNLAWKRAGAIMKSEREKKQIREELDKYKTELKNQQEKIAKLEKLQKKSFGSSPKKNKPDAQKTMGGIDLEMLAKKMMGNGIK